MSGEKLSLLAEQDVQIENAALTADGVIDRVGQIFETVHSVFNRCPEDFEALAGRAVFVPFYAVECAEVKQPDEQQDRMLSMLCENLELPFSKDEFVKMLGGEGAIERYSDAVALFSGKDSFWTILGRDAQQDEWDSLTKAFLDIFAMFGGKKPDKLMHSLCIEANRARIEKYCAESTDTEIELERLREVYLRVMKGSGIAEDEQEFFLSALICYSIWEICGDELESTAGKIPELSGMAESFCDMLADQGARLTLDDMFECTENSAGSFWKTLYTAAKNNGDDSLVALTAAYLEALLLTVSPEENKQKCAEHRSIILRLVV